jgi:predicted nucleic acid-binding Zn finger protein
VSDGDGGPGDADAGDSDGDVADANAVDADDDPADADAGDDDPVDADAVDADDAAASDAYAVPTETDSDVETAWRRELAEAGELTPNAVDAMISLHDGRGARAVEAVSEGRVKRYRDFTVVVGHEDEYVVEDGGCTCKDSSYNLDPEDPEESCWHVLAVAIAERIGEVDHHEMWYSDVREFL